MSLVAGELERAPDVALVRSFYGTHDPAMVSRDGRSTYVLAYFKPLSDKALKDVATQIESRFAGQRDVKLGGLRSSTPRRIPRSATTSRTPSCSRSR